MIRNMPCAKHKNRVSTSPFTLILRFSFCIVTCSHKTWNWRQPRTQTLSTVRCPASAVCDWPNRIKIKCELYAKPQDVGSFFGFQISVCGVCCLVLVYCGSLFAFNLSYVIICVYLFNDSRSERQPGIMSLKIES